MPCADGCALLLSHVNQINMTREKRVSWFVQYRRPDGWGGYLSFDGEIGRSPSSAVVTPGVGLSRHFGNYDVPSRHIGYPDVHLAILVTPDD